MTSGLLFRMLLAFYAFCAVSHQLGTDEICLAAENVTGDQTSLLQQSKWVRSNHLKVRDAMQPMRTCGGDEPSFDSFMKRHKRSYAHGSKAYTERQTLFLQRAAEAREHNCRPGKVFWIAGTTSLADWTDEELAKLRGRKGTAASDRHPQSGGRAASERLATLQTISTTRGAVVPPLPKSFSWNHLESMGDQAIFDQGACGSCWASASAVMLRAHTDIYSKHRNLSVQQLVSCTPNPEQCGGTGGCNGSTGELALDYVYHNGLGSDEHFPYKDTDMPCPSHLRAKNPHPVPQPNYSLAPAPSMLSASPLELDFYAEGGDIEHGRFGSPGMHSDRQTDQTFTSPAQQMGMIGWSRLPVNKVLPLKHALYREGPIAVSIVAGYAWNAYVSGIMNNCTAQDKTVNHLVVLTGFGVDDHVGVKYWHIQNSWGTNWGEKGKIRMIRKSNRREERDCGMDTDPSVGTGCKGGPSQVRVCGSCGILYDNVVAHFHGSTPSALEMLERRGQTQME